MTADTLTASVVNIHTNADTLMAHDDAAESCGRPSDPGWVSRAQRTAPEGSGKNRNLSSADAFARKISMRAEQGSETPNIPAETSRRLACDASVIHWIDTEKGEPLNIGRKSRTIPPAIRRALHRRDGGCRFPGCTSTRFVDAHHIHHWADGGSTSMGNLVLLCRRHHRLVHEEGYGIQTHSTGDFVFTLPDGQPLQKKNITDVSAETSPPSQSKITTTTSRFHLSLPYRSCNSDISTTGWHSKG